MRPNHRSRILIKALATCAVLTIALGGTPSIAQPSPPGGTSDPMQRYLELGTQAAKADEDFLQAQDTLTKSQAARQRADADVSAAVKVLEQAKGAEQQFQDQVDALAGAAFTGAQFARVGAMLTSESSQAFLERMAMLDVVASNNADSMGKLRSASGDADAARNTAAEAQKRAFETADAAQRAVEDVRTRKTDLEAQIKEVRKAINRLPSADKAALGKVQDSGSYLGPPGAANDALQAALSKRGSQYQWGATGPGEFDCSGLTSWAYKQAGVAIPRTSRQQFGAGKSVPLNALQPGDLLFYDDGTGNAGAIHHVSMYVGSGKMVDAPTEGQLVDVRPMKGDGHLMGARRIVG